MMDQALKNGMDSCMPDCTKLEEIDMDRLCLTKSCPSKIITSKKQLLSCIKDLLSCLMTGSTLKRL